VLNDELQVCDRVVQAARWPAKLPSFHGCYEWVSCATNCSVSSGQALSAVES
jgi:hypothetical protein